jgi:Palmitoyl protein thioesterase
VERSKLRSVLVCHGHIGAGAPQPILYATGTGTDGSQVWALGRCAFEALGRPICTVSFLNRTPTSRCRSSTSYTRSARRARHAHKRVAVTGVSQGGLLARMALTYWPRIRRKVTDVISVAGPQHGVASTNGRAACAHFGCPPAVWQQFRRLALPARAQRRAGRDARANHLHDGAVRKRHGGDGRDASTPGFAAEGREEHPDPEGPSRRHTTHIGTAADSVTLAATTDAVTHRGPDRVSRLPCDVCTHPYGAGFDKQRTTLFLSVAELLLRQGWPSPRVSREPRVRA